MLHTPILLITFNRPDHLRQTMEALVMNNMVNGSELFIEMY